MPSCRPLIVTVVLLAVAWSAGPALALQEVYVDFDSIIDAETATPGSTGVPADELYVYSSAQRTFIVDFLNARYGGYGMMFISGARPFPLADAQVTVNKGFGGGGDGNDFRNVDHNDDAFVNTISIFKFLGKDAILDPWTDAEVMVGTANLVAHEAEHLLGMRHHDALEMPGLGLGGGIAPGDFSPGYPGPSAAVDTGSTISSMHAGGSLGFAAVTTDKYVAQRTVVRLAMAETFIGGAFLTDETSVINHAVPDAQPVPTPGFVLPFPLRPPTPPGEPIPVFLTGKAASVTGMLDEIPGPPPGFLSDYFKFSGVAGEHWTIEAMSYLLPDGGAPRYADNADVAILLLSDTGVLLGYHSGPAVNDDDDDSGGTFFGASLIDIILPYTGDYVIEVGAAGPFTNTFYGGSKSGLDGGSYELFLYTTSVITVAVPAPSGAAMTLVPLAALLGARRRWR